MTILKKMYTVLTPKERKGAFSLIGLMVIGMLFETLSIGLIIPAIAVIMQEDFIARHSGIKPLMGFLGSPSQAQLITSAMLALVVIYLIKNLFLAFLAWRQTRYAFSIQVKLSQRLFATYLHQPYTFHLEHNSAQLIRNVTGEVSLFATAINSVLLIFTESLVLLGIIALLLYVEPIGAMIVAFVLSIAALSFHRVTRGRIIQWGKLRQYHDGLRTQHLQQGLGSFKDMKLLGREGEFLEQYRLHNMQSAHMSQRQATLQQIPRLWLELLAVSGLAILILSVFAQGKNMYSIVPTLGLFAVSAFRLMPSINRVLSAFQSIRYALPVIDTLDKEFKLPAPEVDINQAKNINSHIISFQKDICLSNVSYVYKDALTVAINNVSLTIKKGESVGFIGPSGSGKSTLVDIILGLLPLKDGKVAVDGEDIAHNIRVWQDQIGYVPQTIYLTDDTIKRNVAFGLPNDLIDDFAVRRAIKDAQLEEFIASQPDGMESLVGECGIRLSGGQRQRIGIARALYHNPGVLVLDEATSALDSSTESYVMDAITALHGSKTIIIVAHRLSTVEHCDRLYRLEKGRIINEGHPDKVLYGQLARPHA